MARDALQLPAMTEEETASLQQALRLRRSVRRFSGSPLSLIQVASLLYATHGGKRLSRLSHRSFRWARSSLWTFVWWQGMCWASSLGYSVICLWSTPWRGWLRRMSGLPWRLRRRANRSLPTRQPSSPSARHTNASPTSTATGACAMWTWKRGGASQNLALMARGSRSGAPWWWAHSRDQQAADALRLPRSMRPPDTDARRPTRLGKPPAATPGYSGRMNVRDVAPALVLILPLLTSDGHRAAARGGRRLFGKERRQRTAPPLPLRPAVPHAGAGG